MPGDTVMPLPIAMLFPIETDPELDGVLRKVPSPIEMVPTPAALLAPRERIVPGPVTLIWPLKELAPDVSVTVPAVVAVIVRVEDPQRDPVNRMFELLRLHVWAAESATLAVISSRPGTLGPPETAMPLDPIVSNPEPSIDKLPPVVSPSPWTTRPRTLPDVSMVRSGRVTPSLTKFRIFPEPGAVGLLLQFVTVPKFEPLVATQSTVVCACVLTQAIAQRTAQTELKFRHMVSGH